jgi:ABC-2 type transport system ATP-binding protein
MPNNNLPEVVIEVKNLKKNFGDFEAVKGINFDVKRGEIFGILGPNGAGKTTTLEIIETLTQKSSGKVVVEGLDLDHHSVDIKRKIGIQLQSGGFYPDLNLVELLYLFSDIYGTTIDPMILLEEVNLTEKAKSTVDSLSGGQRQRFSIITTLVGEPSIIFLDEPTTGLDPQARRNLWEIIEELKKRGKTIVLTTHYMDEAEILCDRVAIMDEGRIINIDTPNHLIIQLLTKGFKKPMPTLQATLEDVFLDLTGKQLRD